MVLVADGVQISTYNLTSNAFSFSINYGVIADGQDLLLYVTGASLVANAYAIAPNNNGSVTGITLTANTILINDSVAAMNNTMLGAAAGSLLDNGILYSALRQ